ncbi:MAG TPA: hypothetical protein VMF14_09940 [Solirubrobacteraceae bacterium]|nr:hypothetical protein [Solirubrobacteraceae bacterium]
MPAEDELRPVYRGRALAIIAVAAAVLAVIAIARPSAPHVAPVRVPIELRGWPGGPTGVLPVVRVRIGDSRPVPVLLDTGSTGLVILAKDLPAGSHAIKLGNLTEKWGGGNVTQGRQALARVTVGGLTTSQPVAMGIVDSTTCLATSPHCGSWLEPGVDGILGVRIDPQFSLTNPLTSLPGGHGTAWSIALGPTRGTLELGAPIPADPTASFSLAGSSAISSLPPGLVPAPTQPQLPPDGGLTGVSGAPAPGPAADAAGLPTMCWLIGAGRRTCVPTAFDTGSTNAALFSATAAAPSAELPGGETVTAWRSANDTTPLWSFTSGSSRSDDLVLTSGGDLALMDTGIGAYFRFDITYDAADRRMYLNRSAALAGEAQWRRSAVAVCTRFNTAARTALAAGPTAGPGATLAQTERAYVNYQSVWGRLSLQADDAFAKLRLPAALRSQWAAAIASDRAGSRTLLQVARVISGAPTKAVLTRTIASFQRRYTVAESGWERVMARVKLFGCS